MTPFEYITVLISIILGMGITQLITGVADMIHQWHRVKLYWPHLLWIGLVFFLHLQEWWVTFDLQKHSSWRLSYFLFVVLYPINLFILARLLFPFGSSESTSDFKIFYFENYRKLFLWTILLSLLSVVENIIDGYNILYQIIPGSILILLSVVSYKKYEAEWLHKTIVTAMLLLLLFVLFAYDFEIGTADR